MAGDFLVDDRTVRALAATRQGRVSQRGFRYQSAYAVARLAAMHCWPDLPELGQAPLALRYDWAEDLDEVCPDGTVCLTQCKDVGALGLTLLADVLLGFAPKWLWTPPDLRARRTFRLVCPDAALAGPRPAPLADRLDATRRDSVRRRALEVLGQAPSPRSDRALWQPDADAAGHAELVDALVAATEVVWVAHDVDPSDGVGPMLPAERLALDLLLRAGALHPAHQRQALAALQRILHDDLLRFDPTARPGATGPVPSPRRLAQSDVAEALGGLTPETHPDGPVVTAVGPRFLGYEAARPRRRFAGRPPTWADVVHGADAEIGFIEREATDALLARVRSHLLQPLARGTDRRLHALFVLGGPGTGKSTLVMRAAARLVAAGEVVVADPGAPALPVDAHTAERLPAEVRALARAGRPVLLVLDDPLFAGSGWPDLLLRLGRHGARVAVLAASPTLLWERFAGDLDSPHAASETFVLGPPTAAEQRALAEAHGAEPPTSPAAGLLVPALEAAAGDTLDGAVERLWRTLNDGVSPTAFTEPDALPWPVRAFLIVCWFHRAGVPCPAPVLQAALAQAGRAPGDAAHAVALIAARAGWDVFSVADPERRAWAHEGTRVAAVHREIAERAWASRPWMAVDVAGWVLRASIEDPSAGWRAAYPAAAFVGAPDASDRAVAARLADTWAEAAAAGTVATRDLCLLAAALARAGAQEAASRLREALRAAAAARDPQSWIAALQLGELDAPAALVEAADLSLAPARAAMLANALGEGTDGHAALVRRVADALAGRADWSPGSFLVTWLIGREPPEATADRLDDVRAWLSAHPADTSVRQALLARSDHLPEPAAREVVVDAAAWLAAHERDESVRPAWLAALGRLRRGYDAERADAATRTASWLDRWGYPDAVHEAWLLLLSRMGDPALGPALCTALDRVEAGSGLALATTAVRLSGKADGPDPAARAVRWTAARLIGEPADPALRTLARAVGSPLARLEADGTHAEARALGRAAVDRWTSAVDQKPKQSSPNTQR